MCDGFGISRLFEAAYHDVAAVATVADFADAAVIDVVTALPTVLVAVTAVNLWTIYEDVIIELRGINHTEIIIFL